MTTRPSLVAALACVAGSLLPSVATAADDTALLLANVSAANTGYVRVANHADFALQTFTLEAWVQRNGAGYGSTTDALGSCILAKPLEGQAGSYLGPYHLNWNNAGQALFVVTHQTGVSGVFLYSTAVATPLGRHHLAGTFDGDSLRIYVDGGIHASAAWTLGAVATTSSDVLIGADNFSAPFLRRFDGFIDEVRVWNHARTAGEIAAAMNCRVVGNEPGLVAAWSFDASNLADLTGHGHHGAAQGTAGAVAHAPLAPLSACAVDVGDDGHPALDASLAVAPQPARAAFRVRFDLPRSGPVRLDAFDVTGRRLAVLLAGDYAAGTHEWSGDVAALRPAGRNAGLVFLRLVSGGRVVTRPLVVL